MDAHLVLLATGTGLSLVLAGIAAGMGRRSAEAAGEANVRGARYALIISAAGAVLGVCGAGLQSAALLPGLATGVRFAGLLAMLGSLPVGFLGFLITGSVMIGILRAERSVVRKVWWMLAGAAALSGVPAGTWLAAFLAQIYGT